MEALQEELVYLTGDAMTMMMKRGEQIDSNISKYADDEKKLKQHTQYKKDCNKELEKLNKDIEKLNKKIVKMNA